MKIRFKVISNASKTRLGECVIGTKNERMIKLYVAAVPESGKANRAIIDFLAKEWHLSKNQISIEKGEHTSRKLIVLTNLSEVQSKNVKCKYNEILQFVP